MSGYVCAMKPLKLARAGKPEEARKNIGSSAFRRILRLGAPATLATAMSWFLCQVGAFRLSRSLPPYVWLHFYSPEQSDNFFAAFRDLFRACVWYPGLTMLMVVTYLEPGWSNLEYRQERVRRNSMDNGI